jgi:hypothetical protein
MNEVNAKKKGREFCFEAFKRSTVVYVREDFAKNAGYIPKIILKIPPKENTPRKIALKPAPLPKPAPVPKPLPKAAPVTIDANKKAKLNAMKKRIQARK